MWHFYLEYSRAGFASGYLDVNQIVLDRGTVQGDHTWWGLVLLALAIACRGDAADGVRRAAGRTGLGRRRDVGARAGGDRRGGGRGRDRHAVAALAGRRAGAWCGAPGWRATSSPGVAGGGEDPRYAEILGDGGLRAAVRKVYVVQGLSICLISLPVLAAAHSDVAVTWLVWVGVAVWAVGLRRRVRRRRPARVVQARPRPRPGPGPRPVGLDPAPQLLRRRPAVVGDLARRRCGVGLAARAAHRRVAGGDDPLPAQRHRRQAAGEDDEHPPRLGRLRRPGPPLRPAPAAPGLRPGATNGVVPDDIAVLSAHFTTKLSGTSQSSGSLTSEGTGQAISRGRRPDRRRVPPPARLWTVRVVRDVSQVFWPQDAAERHGLSAAGPCLTRGDGPRGGGIPGVPAGGVPAGAGAAAGRVRRAAADRARADQQPAADRRVDAAPARRVRRAAGARRRVRLRAGPPPCSPS